jgi:2,3-bisphosphoglycerate-dependent phosphoglycerate mutase
MGKKLMFTVLVIAFTISNFDALAQKTIIWLVRHAEKDTANTTDRDPELSDLGNLRATDLAKALKLKKINTIYSTNFKRTLATVAPLANLLKLSPVVYDATDLTAIANKAMKKNKGKAALIVGHSNTLIPVIRALNCEVPFNELADDDYDMLFKVVIDDTGMGKLKITHYGSSHHSTRKTPTALQNNKPGMRIPMM